MSKVRVLIADDHSVVRAGLRMLIASQPDMEVVGEAGDGAEAIAKASSTRPDVVVLDLSMPKSRSTQTIERIVRLENQPRVLILTMHDDPAYFRSAFDAGASGYVVKNAADLELLTAIRAVYSYRTFVDLSRMTEAPFVASPGGNALTKPKKKLSRREAEVLRLLAQGYTNQETAEKLAVSVKTVETYRKRLHEKLELKTRAQLFRFAFESGLLESDVNPPDE